MYSLKAVLSWSSSELPFGSVFVGVGVKTGSLIVESVTGVELTPTWSSFMWTLFFMPMN
jgi:hypothetical protein